MNAIPIRPMTKRQQREFEAEALRQSWRYAEQFTKNFHDQFALEVDATILWALHSEFGFGADRLRRFYDCVYQNREALLERYDMHDDAEFILLHKLREIGADVRKWSEEQTEHVTFRVGGKP